MNNKAVLLLGFAVVLAACSASGGEETIGSLYSDKDGDNAELGSSSSLSGSQPPKSSTGSATSSTTNSSGSSGKIKAACPDDYPLLGEDGNCHACDDDNIFELAYEEDCEKFCTGENGTTKRVNDFWGCKLENCPSHKPLEDAFGECRSCDYDGPVYDKDNCSKCPNRSVQNGYCFFSSCSGRPLMSYDGFCYPCSTDLSVHTLADGCTSVCPDRKEMGNWNYSQGLIKYSGVVCEK